MDFDIKKAQNKVIALQKKVEKQTESLKLEILSICESIDYYNSETLSSNIELLETFNNAMQGFEIQKNLLNSRINIYK